MWLRRSKSFKESESCEALLDLWTSRLCWADYHDFWLNHTADPLDVFTEWSPKLDHKTRKTHSLTWQIFDSNFQIHSATCQPFRPHDINYSPSPLVLFSVFNPSMLANLSRVILKTIERRLTLHFPWVLVSLSLFIIAIYEKFSNEVFSYTFFSALLR